MTPDQIRAEIVVRKSILEDQAKQFKLLIGELAHMEDLSECAISSLEDVLNYIDDAINPEPEEPEEDEE